MTDHMHEADETTTYTVVVNHEEQYSIWPTHSPVPAGWTESGKRGTKRECLDYISVVWTDMRPLSVRKILEARDDRKAVLVVLQAPVEAVDP